MAEEDAERERAKEIAESQEVEGGEKETEDTREDEATEEEEEGKDETGINEEEEEDDDDNADTRQNHRHEEQAACNSKDTPRLATMRRMGAPATKGPRCQIVSKPGLMPLKKRYISARAARQIIPSEVTSPSSDAPIEREILARTSPQHSPPSNPPHEARRREQSPAKRRMTTRSTHE